jgi:hypothetical protein
MKIMACIARFKTKNTVVIIVYIALLQAELRTFSLITFSKFEPYLALVRVALGHKESGEENH